jgi:hypothetical protein
MNLIRLKSGWEHYADVHITGLLPKTACSRTKSFNKVIAESSDLLVVLESLFNSFEELIPLLDFFFLSD